LFRTRLTPFLRGSEGRGARRKLWLGIGVAILLSVALPVVQLVILKMLPFDNKSEFQIIVDLPVGTPLEKTAQVLSEMGAAVAQMPEVTDYQAYAGTAAPINFNGLVRQYYLRAGPEVGDLQVNLVDKHERDRKSHDIAQAIRPAVEAIAKRHGADVKVVEVPPGPPVMSPIVAEIYGPDYDAQMQVAKQVRAVFEKTEGIVAIDDTVEDDAQRFVLRVLQNKAAMAGVAQKDVVETMKMGLAGENVTPIHGSGAKYEIPVRITLPPERQSAIGELLKLTVRGSGGKLVPLSELVEVMPSEREKTIYHKNLLPVVFVLGDTGGKLDSPLYGLFSMRGELKDMRSNRAARCPNISSASPPTPMPASA
jgi:multidrug efflux pump subunit AcrB